MGVRVFILMEFIMNVKEFTKQNIEEFYKTLKELCLIPAPSHHEEKRAEYCKNWLEANGAKGVYIDEALNVVFPINADGSNELTVFEAHTDTVFPDMDPLPYREDDERIYCPAVGDDTESLTALLYTAKYYVENNIVPEKGVLFVCNSCEEGLGNLKGTRQIFKDFEGRISQFVTFDCGSINRITVDCVGSHRYEVTVKTPGGHSFGAFGNKNALAELAKIVTKIYGIEVPVKEGTKTTYNVGSIEGGTSVNTIAQEAKMLCEYRSSEREYLELMRGKFAEIFENAKADDVEVIVKLVGDRPCSSVDKDLQDALVEKCTAVYKAYGADEVKYGKGSTDCNIPLSLGVPAVATSTYNGFGAHTREEYVEKSSIEIGFERTIALCLALTTEDK